MSDLGRSPASCRGLVAHWRQHATSTPNRDLQNPPAPSWSFAAARFTHLTTRQDNRLARQQARTACAAALLRWLHVVITRRVAWDPAIAAGNTPARQAA